MNPFTFRRLLSVEGIDVNKADIDGNTPLHYTSSKSAIALLDFPGTRANVVNSMGQTPLLRHARDLNLKAVDILLGKGLLSGDLFSYCSGSTLVCLAKKLLLGSKVP